MKKLGLILSLIFSFLPVIAQESVATYPTAYRIFAQTGDNIVTNITSAETSIFGSGILGSLSVLPFKMSTPFIMNTLTENPIDITITNAVITTALRTKSAVILMYP